MTDITSIGIGQVQGRNTSIKEVLDIDPDLDTDPGQGRDLGTDLGLDIDRDHTIDIGIDRDPTRSIGTDLDQVKGTLIEQRTGTTAVGHPTTLGPDPPPRESTRQNCWRSPGPTPSISSGQG